MRPRSRLSVERQIELALDVRARLDVDRIDRQAFGPGLVGDQPLAEHVGRRGCAPSSRSRASLTPPALPRPPAWTCALTTQSVAAERLRGRDGLLGAAWRPGPRAPECRTRGTLLSTGTRGDSSGPGDRGGWRKKRRYSPGIARAVASCAVAPQLVAPTPAADTVAADAASRRRTARSDRSRLARHRAGQSLSPAGPAGLLRRSSVFVGARRAIGSATSRSCSSGRCVVYFAAGIAIVVGGRRLLPNLRATTFVHAHGRRGGHQPAPVHASGGVASGLGILFVVPVGAMALLADSRDAFLLAALADAGVLGQQIGGACSPASPTPRDYPAAGILGGIVFLVALLALAARAPPARDRSARCGAQQVDLANLAQLSQYIVQHLRESIVVVDHEDRIRLINESAAAAARRSQRLSGRAARRSLAAAALPTRDLAAARPRRSGAPAQTFVAADGGHVVQPHFAPLGGPSPTPVIVFLEDTSCSRRRSSSRSSRRSAALRQHRARDPQSGRRHEPCRAAARRVAIAVRRKTSGSPRSFAPTASACSQIIENVLSLSRRESTRPERLHPRDWLDGFPRRVLRHHADRAANGWRISSLLGDVEVQVDPSHLHQIVWNLCDNAVKYGARRPATTPSSCASGGSPRPARPFLEVADRGPGIAAQTSRADLRAVLHRQRARHRPRPVHRARARADQRRHASL